MSENEMKKSIELSVYTDIQVRLPRFHWTKKHWTVGNEVLRILESDTHHILSNTSPYTIRE